MLLCRPISRGCTSCGGVCLQCIQGPYCFQYPNGYYLHQGSPNIVNIPILPPLSVCIALPVFILIYSYIWPRRSMILIYLSFGNIAIVVVSIGFIPLYREFKYVENTTDGASKGIKKMNVVPDTSYSLCIYIILCYLTHIILLYLYSTYYLSYLYLSHFGSSAFYPYPYPLPLYWRYSYKTGSRKHIFY